MVVRIFGTLAQQQQQGAATAAQQQAQATRTQQAAEQQQQQTDAEHIFILYTKAHSQFGIHHPNQIEKKSLVERTR